MNRRIPPLNALRAFEAAARHRTLARAAEELSVTPSAVGHQVKHLEAWLGTPLFVATGRSRRLTPAGDRLAADMRAVFDQVDRSCRSVARHGDATELRVSVTPTFAIRWLAPRLGRFQARHPDVTVHITIGLAGVDFDREAIDAAMRFGGPDWSGLAAELLFHEDVFPVCNPSLLQRSPALSTPSDLRFHTLLHTRHRQDDWPRWLHAAGVPTDVVDPLEGPVFELTTMAIDAAQAGSGVAITREAQVRDALTSGSLVAPFRVDLLRGEGCYLLTTPRRREEPAIVAFRDWLRHEAALDGDGHPAERSLADG